MNIEKIIGQAVGEASMQWEPRPTGVFDSDNASKVVNRTVAAIKAHIIEVLKEEYDYTSDHRGYINQKIDDIIARIKGEQ